MEHSGRQKTSADFLARQPLKCNAFSFDALEIVDISSPDA
jgi:hypothetical protein